MPHENNADVKGHIYNGKEESGMGFYRSNLEVGLKKQQLRIEKATETIRQAEWKIAMLKLSLGKVAGK